MYDRILIPTDGSDEARKAAEHGIELAGALGGTVHALYVMDLPGVPRALSLRDDEEAVREEYEQYGERVTGDVRDMATEAGVECVADIRSGTPHEEIVKYAANEEVVRAGQFRQVWRWDRGQLGGKYQTGVHASGLAQLPTFNGDKAGAKTIDA